MKLGIDVSTYLEMQRHNAKYFEGDKQVQPLDMFRANGVDIMRIRLWVDPYGENKEPYLAGTCDMDNFVELATLAQNKGYSIMLDFHYSDFWADPGKQFIPKSWRNLSLEQLTQKVYNYTVETLNVAKNNGIDISYVQVGNEITNGMLWPIGQLVEQKDGPRTNYGNFIQLLKAGIKACREVTPSAAIILHLEKSYDQKIYDEFFTEMANANVDYDIIGYSYYPYWHGTFDQFYANVDFCKKFGKRQMVVELGYAFTAEDYLKHEHGGAHLVVSNDNLATLGFMQEYPISPEGQMRFTQNFLQMAEQHGIEAVCWWEPLWIPGEGICWTSDAGKVYIQSDNPSNRNEWANQCLFDYQGQKLPAFDAFKKEIN